VIFEKSHLWKRRPAGLASMNASHVSLSVTTLTGKSFFPHSVEIRQVSYYQRFPR